jgi:outer membrane receptor protein involved in Fe transport
VGQFYYRTRGIRPNNQLRRRVEDVLIQPALSDRASVLAEFRHSDLDSGDTSLLFDPNNFAALAHTTEDRRQYRLGGRFDVTPGVTVVGVWTREHLAGITDTGQDFAIRSINSGDFGEAATYFARNGLSVAVGGGYFLGHETDTGITSETGESPLADSGTRDRNAWIYATPAPFDNLRVTLGGSWDSLSLNLGKFHQLNPKLGAIWEAVPGTTLRAAYFRTLMRPTISGQTIEPTQVAGFNQLFDDGNATDAKRWGVAVDQKLKQSVFIGAEWSQRRLSVPSLSTTPPNTVDTWKEHVGRVYLNWTPTESLALSAELQWERFVRDPAGFNIDQFADVSLLRLPVEGRWFHPSGIFTLLRTSFVRERGNFRDVLTGELASGHSSFSVVDAGIGWRMPGRAAIGTIEVSNLFDSRFRFQDTDTTNPRVVPSRQVLARVTFGF